MTSPDDLRRENEALRNRISRLSAAVLRISDSLDLDIVLHEIVESARALTGARYGCIATIDESGEARDFVTSDLLPSGTLQGTPMRHRGVHVGNFFLADKAGGREFTDEDEEVLVLFASQAATAIANARTYRRERRARADLEALVETSPVGVAVFDARTGRPDASRRARCRSPARRCRWPGWWTRPGGRS